MYPKKYRLLINDFSAPRIFTKLLKVPTSVLRRLMIRIMIYIDNLLILRKHYERNIYDKGLRDLPIATSRLFDKSEEVCVRSCTRNRVIRIDCEFPNYDSAITSGKDREGKGSKPEVIQGIRGITSRSNKNNRNTFLNHSSSAPSPSTVSLLTATANFIS